MDTREELHDFIKNGHLHYLPHIAIDCAIFGYHNQKLKILLGKRSMQNGWSLPGGFFGKNESLSFAAARILKEQTGLDQVFLQQFYTFGDNEYRLKDKGDSLPKEFYEIYGEDNWLAKRTIAIGFYALVDFSKVKISPDLFFEEFQWYDFNEIPNLLYDHNDMIDKATKVLRQQLFHQPIGYNLLDEEFTLPEIQSLYETILNKSLDRRNFPKKLISHNIIKKLAKRRNIGPHRSPYLYSFDKENYYKALKEGIILVF